MLLILVTDAPFWLVNVIAGVVYAVTMPFVALTTVYVYFDVRVARRARARARDRPAPRGDRSHRPADGDHVTAIPVSALHAQRFDEVLEHVNVPSYVIDVDGVVRWMNEAAGRLRRRHAGAPVLAVGRRTRGHAPGARPLRAQDPEHGVG